MGGLVSRAEVVVNLAAGGVGPEAAEEAAQLLAELGVAARVRTPEAREVSRALREAADAAPDVLFVLAGDGTARAAAQLCGPDGPLLAPLPGGTMNMLPKAIYGPVDWREAMRAAVVRGRPRPIGGGEIGGHDFLVAALVGSPALWAPAREAARARRLALTLQRARRAWRKAFAGRVRYTLDAGARGKAEALIFFCPLASKALPDGAEALEAAAFDPRGAAEVFRMGVHAALDNWRNDPAVVAVPCRQARLWAAGRIPAALDGEPVMLPPKADVIWRPRIARLLAPPEEHGV